MVVGAQAEWGASHRYCRSPGRLPGVESRAGEPGPLIGSRVRFGCLSPGRRARLATWIDADRVMMREVDSVGHDGWRDAVPEYFGTAYPAVARFAEMLGADGVLRGLIGPREVPILWERHILNSAAVAQFLPATGRVIDVGSGAGLPGIVLAAMLPEAEVVLVEPMERRTEWLAEVVDELELTNVVVRRARAEELHTVISADAVTARAVAPLDRLCRWTLPLVAPGGVLVALKGLSAANEVESAAAVIRKLGGRPAEVLRAGTIASVDETTIVRIVRDTGRATKGRA